MLGLGISKSAQGVKSGIVKLLSSLKKRAEYFENKKDSKSTIKEINSYELLDKATILLTPTATSDARVHSVKTYTGDELVTNGTFDTDLTDWQISSWWTWNALGAYHPPTNSHKPLYQQTCEVGKTYKISFDLNVLQGGAKVSLGTNTGSTSQVFATNLSTGSYVYYIKAEYEYIIFNRNNISGNNEYYLDNVSIIDVSSDFDFDRASSATRINSSGLVQDMQSITDPELVLNGDFEELGDELITNGSLDTNSGWTFVNGPTYNSNGYIDFNLVGGNARTDINVVQDKVYKVVYEIKNYQEGTIKFRLQGGTNTGGQQQSGNGIKTEYVTCNDSSNNNFQFFGSSSFIGSVDNVSVKQVDHNNRWSAGNKWSISGGTANKATGATSNISQAIDGISGKLHKVVFTVSNYGGNGGVGASADGSNYTQNEGNDTFTEYITPNSNNLYIRASYSFVGSIDNVSVKEVTFSDDVDLARINYDSNGDNGHILLEPTSINLLPYSEDFTETLTQSNSVLVTSNQIISPDGTLNADKLIPASGSVQSNGGRYYEFSSTGGTDYSVSIFVKQAEYRYVTFTYGSANAYGFHFDLQDGVILQNINNVAYTGIDREVESFGNGWYRLKVSLTDNSTVSNRFISVRPANEIPTATDNNYSTTGDGTSGIYAWGMQLEALSYATSYIPNHGTALGVTRAAETLTGSGNSTLINSTEGVLYAEIAALNDDISQQIGVYGGSSTEQLRIEISNSVIRGQLFNGSLSS